MRAVAATTNCSCSGNGSNKVCTQTYYKHAWVVNNAQHLERLRHRPRQHQRPELRQLRHQRHRADHQQHGTLFAAEQYDSCPAQAVDGAELQLVDDEHAGQQHVRRTATPTRASACSSAGMSLVGGGPFTAPAKDPNYKYTAGHHPDDRRPEHAEPLVHEPDLDRQRAQATTCANVKAAGITLYTVQVNTGGDPTSTLLKNCATDPSKFFLLTSANQMVDDLQADRHRALQPAHRADNARRSPGLRPQYDKSPAEQAGL